MKTKTEREKLLDLLDYQEHCRFCDMCRESPEMRAASLNALVDHLIANNVRVLPVKALEKEMLIKSLKQVDISGKTYTEYIAAIADHLLTNYDITKKGREGGRKIEYRGAL